MLRVMFAEWYSPSCPRGVGRRGAPRTAVASCPRPVCLQQYEDEPVTSPGVPHPSPPPTTRTRTCRSSRWGLLRYRLGRLYPRPYSAVLILKERWPGGLARLTTTPSV